MRKRLPVSWLGVFYFICVLFLIDFLVIIFLLERRRLNIFVKKAGDGAQGTVSRRSRAVRREPLHSRRITHCPTYNAPSYTDLFHDFILRRTNTVWDLSHYAALDSASCGRRRHSLPFMRMISVFHCKTSIKNPWSVGRSHLHNLQNLL